MLSDVSHIAAGALHTCVLTNVQGVKCWGWNISGQLGSGVRSHEALNIPPRDVVGLGPKATAGDADCSGDVDAVDAIYILQYEAHILDEIPCHDNADVNKDDEINSIDAILVLQMQAGLL